MSGDPSFPRASPHGGGRATRPGCVCVCGKWVGGFRLYDDGEEDDDVQSERRRWVSRDGIDKRR